MVVRVPVDMLAHLGLLILVVAAAFAVSFGVGLMIVRIETLGCPLRAALRARGSAARAAPGPARIPGRLSAGGGSVTPRIRVSGQAPQPPSRD